MKRLVVFPTPYPDEILYSVLCRYHECCGIPTARQTNLALWNKGYGKKLYLPDGINNIAAQIPASANLTIERFIEENTIFPLLKPFLPQSKADALINAMKFGNKDTYNIIGFSRVFNLQHRYLRYCNQCIECDTKNYGVAYWHRVHQLPGVYICPLHNEVTTESNISLNDLREEYYPLTFMPDKTMQLFEPDITARLSAFANDTAWLLKHGGELDFSEITDELYDNWLRMKGYRDNNGKTSNKKLAQNLVDYYGQEFLTIFDAYNSGACIWIKRIIQNKEGFHHPLHHLLLIRFLAGSAEEFFMVRRDVQSEYRPFGSSPYPCRNFVCEYHLQDVITDIETTRVHGTPYATFSCPYCGFAYRRKGNVPKEQQYSGQIHILDYGRVWKEVVTTLLADGKSPYKVARDIHCDVRTILAFGTRHNILPPERYMKRKPYVPIGSPRIKTDCNTQREHYRQRWTVLILENPTATRTALRLLDSKCYKWLKENDADWFELNAPPSKKAVSTWTDSDDEYFEKVEIAVKQFRDSPDKPKQISIGSIGKKTGITKPYMRLTSDNLPKTKAFVATNVETLEQWQKRKLLWAVRQLQNRGEILTVYKVRHAATIEDKARKLDEFILGLLCNLSILVASMLI